MKNNLPRPRPLPNRGGAPLGNRNALKTGLHTAGMRAQRARVRARVRAARRAVALAKSARLEAP